MDRDIRIRREQESFTLRAAALIVEDGKLLLVRDQSGGAYYTVGGGVVLGEATAEAAVREAFEETGRRFEVDRLLFVQERFCTYKGVKCHEVAFYHLMKPAESGICEGAHTDQKTETLHWIELDRLPGCDVVPAFLKEALLNPPETVQHIVLR